VTILRGSDGAKQAIPLPEILHGDGSKNLDLQPGDLVTVEAVEVIPVYVMGKVNRPGLYNMRKDSAGILEAVTVAGGTLDDAALTKVTVTHLNGQSETVNIVPVTIEGKQESLIKLSAGDLVVVPESLARFAVLGWVNSPGFFSLKENQPLSLSEALSMAKGTDNRRGGLNKVAVIRNSGGKQERKIYDFNRFLKKGDETQNPVIAAGDIVFVPETSSPDWDRILAGLSTGLTALWAVRGL